jgi:uncharacterized protein involved in exopolysaccharide biosynthesis
MNQPLTPAACNAPHTEPAPNWVSNATLLWEARRRLIRTAAIAFVVSLGIAFIIPKRYEATARIMPPDQGGGGAAMIAALAGRSGGLSALGGLAGSLLSSHETSSLFVDLLRSGTVTGRLIDRFQLQQVYRKRYRIDTAKYLAKHTSIVDDKKTGVITLTVEDSKPERARDLAQAYLDELNQVVVQTNTSGARQERMFIEHRLASVQDDLERAQLALSDFSSTHTTLDIKEQGRAMVESAAKLQGQMIAAQSELGSLEQIYGDGNVRVRAAQARIGVIRQQLKEMGGSDAALMPDEAASSPTALYPSIRQLPRLAVPYADLYRRVRVQETVYELLTQEYEMARIQEAKDIPVVRVLDAPGLPEKKSFPPRLIVALVLTLLSTITASALVLVRDGWNRTEESDPRKVLLRTIHSSLPQWFRLESHGSEAQS